MLQEAVDPLDELLEAIDSRQALTQGSLEGLEENTDQRCTDLESAASKLKDELAQARRGAEATAINLKEECGKWQQSMARTTAEFTAKTSNLHSEIALVSQDLMVRPSHTNIQCSSHWQHSLCIQQALHTAACHVVGHAAYGVL